MGACRAVDGVLARYGRETRCSDGGGAIGERRRTSLAAAQPGGELRDWSGENACRFAGG